MIWKALILAFSKNRISELLWPEGINQDIQSSYVDFGKAFDNVWQNKLIEIMHTLNIDKRTWHKKYILQSTSSNYKSKDRWTTGMSLIGIIFDKEQ